MSLIGFTEKEETFFELKHSQDFDRSFNRDFYARLQLAFQLDNEVTLVERSVYNIFMLLGDVGGFSGLLYAVGAVLIRISNFANAENFVVHSLYEG